MSDFLSVVGLVLTSVGFGFTIWQLVRTTAATDAARLAFERAENRLGANHLLLLLPQLRVIENDLDIATTSDDVKLAIRTLLSYSHTATQIAVWLENDPESDFEEIVLQLRTSATVASTAKALLVSGTKKSLPVVLKSASEQITAMSSHAAGLTTQYQAKVS